MVLQERGRVSKSEMRVEDSHDSEIKAEALRMPVSLALSVSSM